jgi:hypothetical protein
VRRVGDGLPSAPGTQGPRHAHLEGFDLHANVWVGARDRARLEQLCRYLLRPPLAGERLLGDGEGRGGGRPRAWTWAALMRRAFGLDVLRCPRCGGRMTLIATIDDPAIIHRILAHLGLPDARDGPARAAAMPTAPDTQPTLPFAAL